MHVLMISLDSGLFSKKSDLPRRLKEYAKSVSFLSVIVYTPSNNYKPKKISKNVIAYPTNSKKKLSFPGDVLDISARIFSENPFNLVTTQDAHATGMAGLKIKRKYKVPLQVQVHGDYINNKWWSTSFAHTILNRYAVRILKSADNIRVVSKRVEKQIKELGISAKKITRFPIYVNVSKFTKGKPKPPKKPTFLFVGRLSQEKNAPLVIKAFADLINEFPDGKLIIVGDGHQESHLKTLAKRLQINKQVKFVGWKNPLPYYKSSTTLIVPSFYEGWGLVAIEAAASGCPVVMSNVGCAGEIIVHKKSGLVFPVNDLEKLKTSMREIVNNKKLRAKCIKEAKLMIKNLPSEKETIKKLIQSWEKHA